MDSRALVLLVSIVTLVCVTDARLTDPLWIAGFYDGGDLDDLVITTDVASLPVCDVVVTASGDSERNDLCEDAQTSAPLSHSPFRIRPPPSA